MPKTRKCAYCGKIFTTNSGMQKYCSAVNTAEFAFPDTINTSQSWIREAPVGDWFYSPGFTYDAATLVRFIIEAVSRDGNVALNIPMRPDGSIEQACEEMLKNLGKWLDINGQAIYGSRAWTTLLYFYDEHTEG